MNSSLSLQIKNQVSSNLYIPSVSQQITENQINNLSKTNSSATNVFIKDCSLPKTKQSSTENLSNANKYYNNQANVIDHNLTLGKLSITDETNVSPFCLSSSGTSSSTSTFSPATLAKSSITNGAVNSIVYQKYSNHKSSSCRKSSSIMSSLSSSTVSSEKFNERVSRILDFIFYNLGLFISDYAKLMLAVNQNYFFYLLVLKNK